MRFTPAAVNPPAVPAATPAAPKRPAAAAVTPTAGATTDHLQPRPRRPVEAWADFMDTRAAELASPIKTAPPAEARHSRDISCRGTPLVAEDQLQRRFKHRRHSVDQSRRKRPALGAPSRSPKNHPPNRKAELVNKSLRPTRRGLRPPWCTEPRQTRHLPLAALRAALSRCRQA